MYLLTQANSADRALYDSESAQWLTYGQLRELVSRLAHQMQSSSKALVFHFGRNDTVSLAWYLAGVEAGHAVALLNEALAPALKQKLIETYKPEWIVYSSADTDFGGTDLGSADTYVRMDVPVEHAYALARKEPGGIALHPDLAVLLSTSGSTGSPKFVRLTRDNVIKNAESIADALAIGSDECAITSLPFYYSYGLSVINTHLRQGARLGLTRESIVSPTFWSTFRTAECTSFAGVPYTYEMLSKRLKLNELNVPSLHTLTQAGGKLADKLVREFHQEMTNRSGRFYVMYGQTEATARIAVLPWDSLPEKLGSAGRAIPGGSLTIDADGVLTTEPGVTGELLYRGGNVMMGYATERVDLALGDELKGVLRTGDWASLDADGFVYITGRMGRETKVFGMRVNLDEIEAMLKGHLPAAAMEHSNKIVIFCEQTPDSDLSEHCRNLAALLRLHPSAFDFRGIERLPLNANGKVDYQQLRGLA